MDEEGDRRQSAFRGWVVGFVAGAVILGSLFAAYEIGRNSGEGDGTTTVAKPTGGKATNAGKATGTTEATTTEATTTAASDAGKSSFESGCGGCHVLADAGTAGTAGPNLDDLQPDQARVSDAIANGGAGSGAMPSGIYSGKEAEQVSEYVSSVAGQ